MQNEAGTVTYGKSKKAGWKAITETGLSRVALPLPVLFFPAVMNSLLTRARLMPKNVVLQKLIEMFLCVGTLTFALPMSIAIFKQRSMIPREQIDEELKYLDASKFQDMGDKGRELRFGLPPLTNEKSTTESESSSEGEEAKIEYV